MLAWKKARSWFFLFLRLRKRRRGDGNKMTFQINWNVFFHKRRLRLWKIDGKRDFVEMFFAWEKKNFLEKMRNKLYLLSWVEWNAHSNQISITIQYLATFCNGLAKGLIITITKCRWKKSNYEIKQIFSVVTEAANNC